MPSYDTHVAGQWLGAQVGNLKHHIPTISNCIAKFLGPTPLVNSHGFGKIRDHFFLPTASTGKNKIHYPPLLLKHSVLEKLLSKMIRVLNIVVLKSFSHLTE